MLCRAQALRMTYSFITPAAVRSTELPKQARQYHFRGNSAVLTLRRYDITVPLDCPLENVEMSEWRR
jgi:hypothetical protein